MFKTITCTKTLYSYIDKGLFLNLTNNHLWEKWYEVIRGLCLDITEVYGKTGLPVDIVDQVKEKFGTLRFYYHLLLINKVAFVKKQF